jgi:hypothetical protein
MFEYNKPDGNWKAMPAGLAIFAKCSHPKLAFAQYKLAVKSCSWSYESAAELVTGIPKELLIEANKAYDKYSLDEIISRLSSGIPLIARPIGARIIDKLSEPE